MVPTVLPSRSGTIPVMTRFSVHAIPQFLAIPAAVAEVDFARKIRTILNANCTACHGGLREAGVVSFIYRDKNLGLGESRKPVIVPGNPGASKLIVLIESKDPDEVMPWPEHGPGKAAYSDLAAMPDGTVLCRDEANTSIVCARFNLEWITTP
jgi:hypothetical protein